MKRLLTVSLLCFWFFSYGQTKEPKGNEALMNVTVSDFKDNPRKGDIIIFEGTNSGLSFSGVSGADGKFSIIVPKGDTYIVKYREFADNEEYARIEIPGTEGRIVSEITIKLELPKTYVLENVFFDTGKATLRAESNEALNALFEVMQLKETLVIEIAGHTDNVGGQELNERLSQERAEAVRNYLIRKGIKSDRVTAKGYYYSRPIADNDTEEGRAKNRRTEVRVISE